MNLSSSADGHKILANINSIVSALCTYKIGVATDYDKMFPIVSGLEWTGQASLREKLISAHKQNVIDTMVRDVSLAIYLIANNLFPNKYGGRTIRAWITNRHTASGATIIQHFVDAIVRQLKLDEYDNDQDIEANYAGIYAGCLLIGEFEHLFSPR